jgi:hypothetical protein
VIELSLIQRKTLGGMSAGPVTHHQGVPAAYVHLHLRGLCLTTQERPPQSRITPAGREWLAQWEAKGGAL